MNEKIIKDFLTKIAKQDNRSTAAPYFYVIRTQIEVAAYEGCGDKIYYFDSEDPEEKYESITEYIDKQKEYLEYNEMSEEEKEEFDDKMCGAECNLIKVEISYSWQERGMFLTETDAKNHLKSYPYHYSKNSHTYIKHSWAAPELKEFFRAMFDFFGVGYGNLDL